MFSHFFIKRPVFAIVISLVILLTGLVSLLTLPIDRRRLKCLLHSLAQRLRPHRSR